MRFFFSRGLFVVGILALTGCSHLSNGHAKNEKESQSMDTAEADAGPEHFLSQYEAALATQDWNHVAPLVHDDVSVTFSDGSVHIGINEVQKALERNFSMIKGDTYSMSDVQWVKRDRETAVYLFGFQWTGYINGKFASGAGRGTGVLTKHDGVWKLIVEHLAPKG
jgi:ketosteroid isomerase-like protein